MGAIHSTKISGNFGLKLNGSVRSNRKSFEKSGPPFEVDHFSRLDRSDRFDHSDPFLIPGPRSSVSAMYKVEENTYHCTFLLTADLLVLLVQLPQVCSCFASKVYVLAADGS